MSSARDTAPDLIRFIDASAGHCSPGSSRKGRRQAHGSGCSARTPTAPTQAAFLLAAEQAGVPVQYFVNRSGVRPGSTIGPIVAAGLAIPTVDVGNPTLAMHSARELSGTADAAMMIAAMKALLTPA